MCGAYSLAFSLCLSLIAAQSNWYIWNKNFEITSNSEDYSLWWRLSPRPADKPVQILHLDRPSASFLFYYLHSTNELCLKHSEKTGQKRVRYATQTLGCYDLELSLTWAKDDSFTGKQKLSQSEQLDFNFGDLDQYGVEDPCYGDEFDLLNDDLGELGSNDVILLADQKPDLVHCQSTLGEGCAICVDFFAVRNSGNCRFCGMGCNKCRDKEVEPQCSNCHHNYFAQTDPYCLSSGALSLNQDPHFFTATAPNPDYNFGLTFWLQVSPINSQGTITKGSLVKMLSQDNKEQNLLMTVQNNPGVMSILSMLQASTLTGSFSLPHKAWVCIVLQQRDQTLVSFNCHNQSTFTSTPSQFSESNPPVKFQFGNEFTHPIVYNLKYLTLFTSQRDREAHFEKVVGFQIPSGSLPSYIQECWSLEYFSNLQSTSCSGLNPLEEDEAHLASSIVDIRLKHQPSSDLKLCNAETSKYFEKGKCVDCSVGCSRCYAKDKCTDCVNDALYSGPNNGFCVTDTLTPESGVASVSEFRTRDQFNKLEQDLGVASYEKTACIYPDDSVFQTGERKFKLPRSKRDQNGVPFLVKCKVSYQIKGQSFEKESRIQLQQTQAEDIDTSSPRAPINLFLFLSSFESHTQDPCGGCQNGTCDEEKLECNCQTDYGGRRCALREDQIVVLKEKSESVVEGMSERNDPIPLQLMVMREIYKQPLLVTTRTNALAQARISQSTGVNLKPEQVQAGLAILSAQQDTIQNLEEEPQLSQKLQNLLELKKMYSAAHLLDELGPSYSFQDKDTVIVAHFMQAGQVSEIGIGNEATVIMRPQKQDMKLIGILLKGSQGLYPSNQEEQQVSSTLELNVYHTNGSPAIIDASFNLCMKLGFQPRAIDTVDIKYWNGSEMASDGITGCQVKEGSVCCDISHMTSFGGFLRRGKQIIQQANYDVFSSLKSMSAQDLSSNLGFYFLIFYWGLFIVVFSILKRYQTAQLRKIGLEKIIRDQLCKDQEIMSYTSAEESLDSPIISPRKINSATKLNKKKPAVKAEQAQPDHTRHLDSVVVQTARSSEFNLMKADQLQQIDPTTFLGKKELQESPTESEGRLKRKSARRLLSIKKLSRSQRLKIEYASRLRGRHCCLRFMGNVKREISSHNLPINFITTTSAFSPRIMRLCLFTLGILLEVSVCAFFFDLSGQEEEENMTDNFWIGLYSATFVALPMVLSGWLLSYPNKYKKQIEANIHSRNLFQVYQKFNNKFRLMKILGYVVFSLLSAFLSLYIIAFCHKANEQISIDWVKSSIIGVSIDQILFQISPAMVVALFVLLASLGHSLHWIIYMAVCVELYRVYRNLTAG